MSGIGHLESKYNKPLSIRDDFYSHHEPYEIPIIRKRIIAKEYQNLTEEEDTLFKLDREEMSDGNELYVKKENPKRHH